MTDIIDQIQKQTSALSPGTEKLLSLVK